MAAHMKMSEGDYLEQKKAEYKKRADMFTRYPDVRRLP